MIGSEQQAVGEAPTYARSSRPCQPVGSDPMRLGAMMFGLGGLCRAGRRAGTGGPLLALGAPRHLLAMMIFSYSSGPVKAPRRIRGRHCKMEHRGVRAAIHPQPT